MPTHEEFAEEATLKAIETYLAADEQTIGVDGAAMGKTVRVVMSTILEALEEPSENMLEAVISEPAYLYTARSNEYKTKMQIAVKVERLIFRQKWRSAILASALVKL